MRPLFRFQYSLASIPVVEVEIPDDSRHAYYALGRSLQWLYPQSQSLTEKILRDVSGGKKTHRGAPGMSGWQILVLVAVRMSRDLSFDDTAMEFNEHRFLRRLLEIDDHDEKRFSAQTLQNNFSRLRPETLDEILFWVTDLMAKVGIEDGQQVRGDSFVCGRPIHYPTDQAILSDGARKIISLCHQHVGPQHGWRQAEHLGRKIKRLCRQVGMSKRGKKTGRGNRIQAAYRELIKASEEIGSKALETIEAGLLPQEIVAQVVHYLMLLDYGIELVVRRIMDGQDIANKEKLLSIFEHETELINRGKIPVAFEYGHRVYVAQGKSGMIVDWRVMDGGATDASEFEKLLARLKNRYGKIKALSLDKGFWVHDAIKLAEDSVELLAMSKKGGRDAAARERESNPEFIELRKWRSGIESLISSLVRCNGLKCCKDKGMVAFRRWVLAAILTRNLVTLGRLLEEGRIKAVA